MKTALPRHDISEYVTGNLIDSDSYQDEHAIPNDSKLKFSQFIELEIVAFNNLAATLIAKHGVGKIECFSYPDIATDSNIVRVVLTVLKLKS